MYDTILQIAGAAPIPDSVAEEANQLIARAVECTLAHKTPFLLHLCGIPGVGKTTYADDLINTLPEGTFLLRFDGIMEQLSGYQKDLAHQGNVAAFSTWELPARIIGYHVLARLVDERRSVLFDHSGSFAQHIDLLHLLRENGYKTEMHHLQCPPQIAVNQVEHGEKLTKRHTPRAYLLERQNTLAELAPLYKRVVCTYVEVSTYCEGESAITSRGN